MEALKQIPALFLILAVAGIVLGAGMITLSKFGDTLPTKCFNDSYTFASNGECQNNTAVGVAPTGVLNFSEDYLVIYNTQAGLETGSEQFSTIGIIVVMVIIISLLVGLFAYLAYFK